MGLTHVQRGRLGGLANTARNGAVNMHRARARFMDHFHDDRWLVAHNLPARPEGVDPEAHAARCRVLYFNRLAKRSRSARKRRARNRS